MPQALLGQRQSACQTPAELSLTILGNGSTCSRTGGVGYAAANLVTAAVFQNNTWCSIGSAVLCGQMISTQSFTGRWAASPLFSMRPCAPAHPQRCALTGEVRTPNSRLPLEFDRAFAARIRHWRGRTYGRRGRWNARLSCVGLVVALVADSAIPSPSDPTPRTPESRQRKDRLRTRRRADRTPRSD